MEATMAHNRSTCNLRDCQCSDDGCSRLVSEIAAAVKADIPNNRIRERLQVLEAWKLDADETEMLWIVGHAAYLRHLLDPHRIPTSSYEPGWFEMRRKDGDYDD